MGHGWLSVSPDQARIEMNGGFYHYGYLLTHDDQASTADTNVWHLFLYREDADDRLLVTLRILKTEAMSATSLFEIVLPGYDEQIAAHPDSLEAHQGKIQFLLHFDRVDEARAAVKELLHAMPDNWWANLVNALAVAETQSPERAEQSLLGWVKQEPNFFKYLDLAYYYQLQQRPQKAARAMLEATQYDANTTWGAWRKRRI
jgi:predicted Zn-dependent protease